MFPQNMRSLAASSFAQAIIRLVPPKPSAAASMADFAAIVDLFGPRLPCPCLFSPFLKVPLLAIMRSVRLHMFDCQAQNLHLICLCGIARIITTLNRLSLAARSRWQCIQKKRLFITGLWVSKMSVCFVCTVYLLFN